MQQEQKTPHFVFRKRQVRASQATPEEEQLHQQSKQQYPELALSPGEYVLERVNRHPIGLFTIWAMTALITLLAILLVPFYASSKDNLAATLNIQAGSLPSTDMFLLPAFILAAFFMIGGFVATYVYNQNRFYITTESIIQFVQYSLFSSKQQVVNLINVEDVSADKHGILQQMLNYGTLRLSTQGEETIYHFQFVANPDGTIHRINDAVEIAVQRLEGSNLPPTEF